MSAAYHKGNFTLKLNRIAPLLDQAIHYKCQNAKMEKRYKKKKIIASVSCYEET